MKDQPFEGDGLIAEEIKRLIDRWHCEVVIETGTEYGATAHWFSKLAQTYTIEKQIGLFQNNLNWLAGVGVIPLLGASEILLPPLLKSIPHTKRIFFYLDAHDMSGTVVREELKIIRDYYTTMPPVVAIHDVRVPNKDFGFDVYENGQELTYWYFKDLLTWSCGHFFNTEARGARRGIIYIVPKEPCVPPKIEPTLNNVAERMDG